MSANIGNMPLNCLLFQDDIALEDVRKGTKEIGRMLESKQLKSKVKICGDWIKEIKERILKRGREESYQNGRPYVRNSAIEKYLGDKINEKRTAASITETI